MNRQLSAICNFKKVKTINPEATIKEAVDILNEHHIGCLVVMNDKVEIEGIMSERDILTILGNTNISDDMKPNDIPLIMNIRK